MMSDLNRIVALIDMDCFYCQVEEKINPNLKGKPIAVVQYNEWRGGGIIAVNYLARAKGVTRSMRGDDAKEKCPDIELPKVPCVRGKADISKYREAGKEVAHVLQKFTPLLERASIDEAYLDITQAVVDRLKLYERLVKVTEEKLPNTYVLGYPSVQNFISDIFSENNIEQEIAGFDQEHSLRLLIGAEIISEVRAAVYQNTGYRCSAGIADSKIMSKLVCGMNKPNKQTVLPRNSVSTVFESLPLTKIKSLGGKFGTSVCEILKITKMKELLQFSEKELQKHFEEKNGSFLYNIARGIDTDPVTPRFSAKSIGCCKRFAGKTAIVDLKTLTHWLGELGDEIEERLKTDSLENNRHPTQMVVSFTKQLPSEKEVSCSRSLNIQKSDDFCGNILAENSLQLIRKDSKPFLSTSNNQTGSGDEKIDLLTHPIKFLGISVGKFEDIIESKKSKNIQDFFNSNSKPNPHLSNDSDENTNPDIIISKELSSVSNSNSPKQVEVGQKTTLIEQESFFSKYLKGTEATVVSTDIQDTTIKSVTSVSVASTSKTKKTNENHKSKSSRIDDACSSDDSLCTIELEIDRSLHLPYDDQVVEEKPRPSLLHKLVSNSVMSNQCATFESNETDSTSIFCDKCDKNILEKEFDMHCDYHFALSIREEDRKNNKTTSVIVKSKINMERNKKPLKEDIKKPIAISNFFKKVDSVMDDDNMEQCSECGKRIHSSDLSEHMDFHEAKKLHLEINRPAVAMKSSEALIGKRKRISPDEKNSKHKSEKSKPISSFFK